MPVQVQDPKVIDPLVSVGHGPCVSLACGWVPLTTALKAGRHSASVDGKDRSKAVVRSPDEHQQP
ncbi:MAG TPA: hypothetical protein VI094_04060 [Propionibacteriaceae bacterium]